MNCHNRKCKYQEPHNHGFACDYTCGICGGHYTYEEDNLKMYTVSITINEPAILVGQTMTIKADSFGNAIKLARILVPRDNDSYEIVSVERVLI